MTPTCEVRLEWFIASKHISHQATCLCRKGDLSPCGWLALCDGFTEADPQERQGVSKLSSHWLPESGGLTGVLAVVVGVEAGLDEEDAGADALCVAVGVDGVLGELCSCLTKATAAGSRGTCSLCSMYAFTRERPQETSSACFLCQFHPW
ncbi:hypothetical protein MHYP_G00025170 [Metynnis hypsauchen]